MKELLQKEANKYSLNVSKKELVNEVYNVIEDCCIFNDIYLEVNGVKYQFIKSKKENKWIVKEF